MNVMLSIPTSRGLNSMAEDPLGPQPEPFRKGLLGSTPRR